MDTGTARKYFTFYYIPLIPYKNLGRVTQCRSCKSVYQSVDTFSGSNISTPSTSTNQEIRSYYESGTADFQAGRHDMAIINFEVLLRFKGVPEEILAKSYQLLSRSYVEQGEWDDALHYSDKLFSMVGSEPPSLEDHSLRIQICMMAGNTEKVMEATELAKKRYGDRFNVNEVDGGIIISNSQLGSSITGEKTLPSRSEVEVEDNDD